MRFPIYRGLIQLHAAHMEAPPLSNQFLDSNESPPFGTPLFSAHPMLGVQEYETLVKMNFPVELTSLEPVQGDAGRFMSAAIPTDMDIDHPALLPSIALNWMQEPMDVIERSNLLPLMPPFPLQTDRKPMEDLPSVSMVVDPIHEVEAEPDFLELYMLSVSTEDDQEEAESSTQLDLSTLPLAAHDNPSHEVPEPDFLEVYMLASSPITPEVDQGQAASPTHVDLFSDTAFPLTANCDYFESSVVDAPNLADLTESLSLLKINVDGREQVNQTLNTEPPIPTSPSVHDTTVTRNADSNPTASQHGSFHISDLESSFDDKKFTYLSELKRNEPLFLHFLPASIFRQTDGDTSPGSKGWVVERLGNLGERLKEKTAVRVRKALPKTPRRITRTRKELHAKETPRQRQHPYRFEFTPLPSTNHTLESLLEPTATPLRKTDVQYKQVISESVSQDLWTQMPSPPPSPTLSWMSSKTERRVRFETANFSDGFIPISVAKTDDTQTPISVSPRLDDPASKPFCLSTDTTQENIPYPLSPSSSLDIPCTPPQIEIRTDNPRPLKPRTETFATRTDTTHSRSSRTNGPTTRIAHPDRVSSRIPRLRSPFLECRPRTGVRASEINTTQTGPEHSPCLLPNGQHLTPLQEKDNDEFVFPGAFPIHELENANRPFVSKYYPNRPLSFSEWFVQLITGY